MPSTENTPKRLLLISSLIGTSASAVFAFLWLNQTPTPPASPNAASPPALKGEKPMEPDSQTSPQPVHRATPHPISAGTAPSVALAPVLKSVSEPPPADLPLPPKEVALNLLVEYSSSYDSRLLPKIEPYLYHRDKELREAAVNAIISLGDASGGSLLRKAAEIAEDPEEVKALIEWAKYVELPSGRLGRKLKN